MNWKTIASGAGVVAVGALILGTSSPITAVPDPNGFSVDSRVYTKDTVSEPQILSVPDGATSMKVSLSRESWKEASRGRDVVAVTLDYFNGKTWRLDIPLFAADGGIRYDEHGAPLLENYWMGGLPNDKGRQIRLKINAMEDISSQLKVTFQ